MRGIMAGGKGKGIVRVGVPVGAEAKSHGAQAGAQARGRASGRERPPTALLRLQGRPESRT